MLRIEELTKDGVLLVDRENDNWTCGYCNSTFGRERLMEDLERLDSMKLWDEKIHEQWGDSITIFDIHDDPEQVRAIVRSTIKSLCNQAIVKGVDVDCGLTNPDGSARGALHYSLSERHQTDMRDLATMLATGLTSVTWRDDSRVSHEVYTAEQFMTLYQTCSRYILRCRFHSDALETILDSCTDINTMLSINWDTEIPAEIQAHIDELWSTMYPNG